MTTFLATVFVLGVLIFFHELGHFLAAKRAGIRVDRFSLGFPPSLIKKKIGETEYCIGVIPLGGYVKMAGETPGEETSGAPDEFMSKSAGTRSLVVVAGPLMNFVFAWLILWGVFFFRGEESVDPDYAIIGFVVPGSPAEQAGLLPGDTITAINGRPVVGFPSVAEQISSQLEKAVTISWRRGGRDFETTITTYEEKAFNEKGEKISIGMIGIGQQVLTRKLGIIVAAARGAEMTVKFSGMVFTFIHDLAARKVSPKMIGGPVFIAQMAGEVAETGFTTLLVFMALLSVNLAVLNILPIPVLDGGHLVFLLIEKIKGKPLTIGQRALAQQIGFVFLLVIIIMVTYNDIVRVFFS